MVKKLHKVNVILTILIVLAMVFSVFIPIALADTSKTHIKSFDRGVSWKPIIPMKRTTFVNFEEESYLDDYAYLAATPTAVFYDKNGEQILSNPLLFYQDEYDVEEDKERSLNARQGLDYFMEDWMSYCNGYLDQMTLINVPKSKLDEDWISKNYTNIEGIDPFDIASQIALHDWSYSENAVIAVIEETPEKPDNHTSGTIDETLSERDGVLTDHFEIPQTNEVYPMYSDFTVPEGYKFLKVRSWYPSFYFQLGLPIPGFENVVNMTIPAGDRDIQIYCEHNGQRMMAGITNAWNARVGMDYDKTSVYVYNSGTWSVALTDVPTKSSALGSILPESEEDTKDSSFEVQKHRKFLSFRFGRYGSFLDIFRNI